VNSTWKVMDVYTPKSAAGFCGYSVDRICIIIYVREAFGFLLLFRNAKLRLVISVLRVLFLVA